MCSAGKQPRTRIRYEAAKARIYLFEVALIKMKIAGFNQPSFDLRVSRVLLDLVQIEFQDNTQSGAIPSELD